MLWGKPWTQGKLPRGSQHPQLLPYLHKEPQGFTCPSIAFPKPSKALSHHMPSPTPSFSALLLPSQHFIRWGWCPYLCWSHCIVTYVPTSGTPTKWGFLGL